jgi:hypothetical protein
LEDSAPLYITFDKQKSWKLSEQVFSFIWCWIFLFSIVLVE